MKYTYRTTANIPFDFTVGATNIFPAFCLLSGVPSGSYPDVRGIFHATDAAEQSSQWKKHCYAAPLRPLREKY
ncbi:MAG: hypothetical protein QM763_24250 [Agriterribacter sp.]